MSFLGRDIAVNVISGVLVTAVLAGFAAVWVFVPSLIDALISWLANTVLVPVWLLLLLGLVVLIAAVVGGAFLYSRRPDKAALTFEQNAVLSKLAASHPQNLTVAMICRLTGLSSLSVDAAIDGLSLEELVSFPMIMGGDVEYYLTSKGRQYVLKHGLA